MKKITIFFWDGWLDVSPTLLSILTFCKLKGYKVDFVLRDNCTFDSKSIEFFQNENIIFFKIQTINKFSILCSSLIKNIEKIINITKNKLLVRIFYHIIFQLKYLSSYKELKCFRKQIHNLSLSSNDIGIFIDSYSLFTCNKILNKFKVKYYLSLEILNKSEIKFDWLNFILKYKESSILNNQIDLVIIQDNIRFNQLMNSIHKINNINSFYLPNSVFKDEINIQSDFFREKFNISKEQKILLAAGMISEFVSSYDIAKVMGQQTLVSNITTIFHNRIKDDYEQFYLNKILDVSPKNFFLSLDPVPFNQLYKIYNSVNIGLVIYNSSIKDLNYTEIGSASGKLFQFAKYGIPVIASNLKGMTELVKTHNLGVIINSVDEIPDAILEINKKYDFYSKSALIAFEKHFCMEIYLDKIL